MKIASLLILTLLLLGGLFFLLSSLSNRSRAEDLALSPADYADGQKRFAAIAQKITPALKAAFTEKNLPWGSPVFLRAFKEERLLELWVQPAPDSPFILFQSYPILGTSGTLGPKLREGDRQIPEGFYFVPPSQMNPQSNFHLAFNIGYPNAYDQAHQRTGSFIMIHGSDVSIGCLAMSDQKIEEIYTLCHAAHQGGQKFFRVHLFPFRLTPENLARHPSHPHLPFWQNLQTGYQWFEDKKSPPNVTVQNQQYHFSE